MRGARDAENDLLDRLAADERLGLDRDTLAALIIDPMQFTGAARSQVAQVVKAVETVAAAYPQAAAYSPGDIL